MTDSQLQTALRAGARGIYALEAGTGLLIAHGCRTLREDFMSFVHVVDSITSPGTELASIDWEAAITVYESATRRVRISKARLIGEGRSSLPSARKSICLAVLRVSGWSGPRIRCRAVRISGYSASAPA